MALLYAAAGINHFISPDFYRPLMPDYWPAPMFFVYLSGVVEIVLAFALLIRRTRRVAAGAIVAMLVVFLLVHGHMIQHAERFPSIPYWALWLRLPMQGVLMLWAGWHWRRASVDPHE